MKIIYDEFVPIAEAKEMLCKLNVWPIEVQYFTKSGRTGKETFGWVGEVGSALVAIKIPKPVDPLEALASDVSKRMGFAASSIQMVLRELNKMGKLNLKVDVNPQPEPAKPWIEQKLKELDIRGVGNRVYVRNWFNNPDLYPDVPFDLGNKILTVKYVNNVGGRVVVSPVGHTLAYTTAQRIWRAIFKRDRYDIMQSGTRITAGEYTGRRSRARYSSEPVQYVKQPVIFDHGAKMIRIGCQTIPFSAIEDLAKRENWS